MSRDTFRYGGGARLFHWVTAGVVLAMVPAGFVMIRVGPGSLQNSLFDFHRSVGVVLMVLTLARLFWRLRHPPQPLPDAMPVWQRRAAGIVHGLLYGFLLLNPLVGWVATSAFGAAIEVFGLFTLPPLTGQDRELAASLFRLHMALGLAFTALIFLHIGAALHHHFVLRDDTLRRMLG
ncbi:cytochrome b [Pannonibacter sp. P2PFMT1]|uniref:cytochrome b n=1 Tax=Pannonibacter sp. P2PFMT1 TaxID=2003582 RepID=UPI0016442E48|nr:cytochrome b [Pannonibacter sp. P2PFMT1]